MAAAVRKHRSRRRVAAFNFLSNISLDGTHRDTRYAIFNRKGLSEPPITCSSDPKHSVTEPENLRTVCDDIENRPPVTSVSGPTSRDVTGVQVAPTDVFSADCLVETSTNRHDDTSPTKRYSFPKSSPVQVQITYSDEGGDTSGVKRASSFSGERLPQPKRRLFHTLSISEDAPSERALQEEVTDLLTSMQAGPRVRHRSTSSSTSSVASFPSVKKEVKFVKPGKFKPTRRDRLVVLSENRSPVAVFSAVPYNKDSMLQNRVDLVESLRMRKSSSSQMPLLSTSNEGLLGLGLIAVEYAEDGQDVSYSQFLVSSRTRFVKKMASVDSGSTLESSQSQSSPAEGDGGHGDGAYNPNLLDDPELRSGKHRTLMTFPSYVTSVIDYVRPSELKKDLNEKFKEKFPHLQLTLSKLRSLKRGLHKIGHMKCNIDLWTISQSYVFFEKIILKGLITKQNRKLCAGACLLLSAKLNDIKGPDLTKLIEEIEDSFRLHRKDLLAFEFAVLVALEFSLHVPDKDVYPLYQRLMYTS